MKQYAYLNSGVEAVSFSGRTLTSCKICSEQPVDKLCSLIRMKNRCCLGTNTICVHNSCPNNQK